MSTVRPTLVAAAQEAFARRASFWAQLVIMVLNDAAWVGFWLLVYARVGDIRGWDRRDVLLLLAILTTAGGVVLGLLSNARNIPVLVADGRLDATLLLPCRPLRHLLVREVKAVNVGDLAFGVALFAAAGRPTPARVAAYVLGSACGAAVLAGFLVFTGSLTFFTGRGEGGELGFHAMLLLAAYPAEVFTGAARLVLYVVVPAAFVASVPARLVDDPDPALAAACLAAALVCSGLGWATFTLGLRRYTSGAGWTGA